MEMFGAKAQELKNAQRKHRRFRFLAALIGALAAQTVFAIATNSPGPTSGSLSPRTVQTLSPLPPALVEGLKRQDGSQTKGRLQIGLGRGFEKPLILSRETAATGDWS